MYACKNTYTHTCTHARTHTHTHTHTHTLVLVLPLPNQSDEASPNSPMKEVGLATSDQPLAMWTP